MDQAQKAVGSIVDGVKKVAVGEKKQKVKKDKSGGGDGGADAVSTPPPPPQFLEPQLTHEIYRDHWR